MLAGAPSVSAHTPGAITPGQFYRITAGSTSLAIDVEGSSSDHDAHVVQNPVNLLSNSQLWQVINETGGYEVRNAATHRCLSVYYNSAAAGAKLVQYDCHA